ncbi:uncharacterized protein METZ01_LOCUS197794 [marine metagenome]|jgi:hypothetical protein|uniref:Uncharacterized protein n=1 Tax=marine metagenome TaxID=408172 RepID=A0A382E2K6_9ZZZZ|tara:strand:- start:453 stop:599 length:147 start_codon:yes stop_codon:yes gene_type:complete
MARGSSAFIKRDGVRKKTSVSGSHKMVKFASMNKSKKASYKKYRGQGH